MFNAHIYINIHREEELGKESENMPTAYKVVFHCYKFLLITKIPQVLKLILKKIDYNKIFQGLEYSLKSNISSLRYLKETMVYTKHQGWGSVLLNIKFLELE